MSSPDQTSTLVASNVGEYILGGSEIYRVDYVQQQAERIADEELRHRILGGIAAAPNAIVWRASAAHPPQLDDAQKQELHELSMGIRIPAIANNHFRSYTAEHKRLRAMYDLLGAKRSAPAVVAAFCLDILSVKPDTGYRKGWLNAVQLRICRSVALGGKNEEIARKIAEELALEAPVSADAIRSQIARISGKVGARNRPHLMRRLFETTQFRRYQPGLIIGDPQTISQAKENPQDFLRIFEI